jgi:hypothetical protein
MSRASSWVRVDLPEPVGPTTAIVRPGVMENVTSFSTGAPAAYP